MIALSIIAAVVIGTIVFAILSVRKIAKSPEEFIVGGRGFGAVFLWVLLAGEIYTSFTFLGASGWAYNLGAPAFYIMAYGTVGYILGYFLLPRVWRIAKEHGLLTQPDFFAARYNSKPLATLAAVIQCAAIVPYVTLQISALQIFLSIAGEGAIGAEVGAIISFLAIIAFVFLTGLRGTAWASIVKDVFVLGALAFIGIVLPIQFFGSHATMFNQLIQAHPAMLTLQGWTTPKGQLWYISTVLLTGIGYFMGAHSIAATYSAKDELVLRRNAMLLPIYHIIVILVFFAGFAALLLVPGMKAPASDQSYLLVIAKYYPPWVLGFIAGAGALCALVPSTALLLSSASILAKNIGSDVFGIARDDRSRVMLTRAMVVFMGLLALVMWMGFKTTIVQLLLLYYNGVSQFAPAFFFGIFWKVTSRIAVATGLIVGIVVAVSLAALSISPFGINPGFIALALNAMLVVGITLLRRNATAS